MKFDISPDTQDLIQAPELATLFALQTSARLAVKVLDIKEPQLGCLVDLAINPSPRLILAQVILDRCNDLSELISCYRLLVHPPVLHEDWNDYPF